MLIVYAHLTLAFKHAERGGTKNYIQDAYNIGESSLGLAHWDSSPILVQNLLRIFRIEDHYLYNVEVEPLRGLRSIVEACYLIQS